MEPASKGAFLGATLPFGVYALGVLFFLVRGAPQGSDGNWALFGFVVYLPGLMVVMLVCSLLGYWIGRSVGNNRKARWPDVR